MQKFSQKAWFDAVNENNISRVKAFIEQGIEIDLQDDVAWTALHIASNRGHLALVELLLAHNANPNIVAQYEGCELIPFDFWGLGVVPLHYASRRGYKEIVKLLLEYNADIRIKDPHGTTALHFASKFGYTEIVQMLEEYEKK